MHRPIVPVMPSLPTPVGLTLKHYSPTIGTEVLGIDLREPLDDAVFAFLHQVYLERKVLFFRDQDLTPEQHLDFGRRWGELEVIPFLEHDDTYPELLTIRRGSGQPAYENVWHSDVSWRSEPSMGSALRALKVPEVGGDTLFCDMTAVYESLSPGTKELIEPLQAVHSIANLLIYIDQDTLEEMLEKFPPQIHPVVRTHPETGQKLLYVNRAHTQRLKGFSRDESQNLLEQLYRHASIPEFQCRFHWEAGSIAFWDNRSCQHYAANDYFPQERFMDRITIKGDKPF